jgi:hypothetical protein
MEDMRMRWDVNENVWIMHKRGSVLFFEGARELQRVFRSLLFPHGVSGGGWKAQNIPFRSCLVVASGG